MTGDGMNLNPMMWPTAVCAAVLLVVGAAWQRRSGTRLAAIGAFALGLVLAVPALLYALYYLHLFDDAAWFYDLRAARGTELLAGGIGFPTGYLAAASARGSRRGRLVQSGAIAVTAAVLLVPYSKPLLMPLDLGNVQDRWRDGVCLQSTSATCGPACAATLLRHAGIEATEGQMAKECFSYARGTENWYMARALRRRGLRVAFAADRAEPEELRYPAIAGVRLGRNGPGHFVTVLGREGDGYVVGDPLRGRVRVALEDRSGPYFFTGFFMVVGSQANAVGNRSTRRDGG